MGMTNENNVELIDRNKLLDVIDGDLRIGADDSWMWDKIVNEPTVEAIPKADYESRLRAEKIAMLTEIQTEIMELPVHTVSNKGSIIRMEIAPSAEDAYEVIQQKINALKGDSND